MTALRGILRSSRGPFSFTLFTSLSVAVLFYYASSEHSTLHHHALDDYNDKVHWALNRANPLSLSLVGGSGKVGGWETKRDGKLVLNFDEMGNLRRPGGMSASKVRHPFYDLMDKAEKEWNTVVKRQSRTLHEAVREYKRRYGRMPPKGFDKWFKFAVDNNVQLIDEFDQIEHDILPYLAVPPEILRPRIAELEGLPSSFHIEILAGDLEIYGPLDEDARSLDVAELIQDFAHLLPDLTMHASGHDAGSQIFGEDFRSEVGRLVSKGEYLAMDNITHFENRARNPRKTLINACLETSPAVTSTGNATNSQPKRQTAEFIHDHRKTMNFCENPAILEGHGALVYNNARGSNISPYFVMCKLDQGGELLMPALSGYADRANQKIVPWAERNSSTIFWRGRTTGNHFNKEHDWHKSHRIVLHNITNNNDGHVDVLVEDPQTRVLSLQSFSRKQLNDAYMDIGLAGKPTQCQNDGTCEEMAKGIDFRPLVSGTYGQDSKYAIDVDGNGWSQRFQKLLASGSVVLKATIFPEWNSKWLIPYYHYVPIQHDYSDLYDTMVFFAGTPDGNGGHDELAERISSHAVEFAAKYWRWEDMQAYMFRLLLEYARLGAADREKMTFKMGTKTALRV